MVFVVSGYGDVLPSLSLLQVLRVLVRAVSENIPDAAENESGRLRSKLQELFGRQTSKVSTC